MLIRQTTKALCSSVLLCASQLVKSTHRPCVVATSPPVHCPDWLISLPRAPASFPSRLGKCSNPCTWGSQILKFHCPELRESFMLDQERSSTMIDSGGLQQAKLVLLGDMGAGKSSLVLRFVKGQFFDYQVPAVTSSTRAAFVWAVSR